MSKEIMVFENPAFGRVRTWTEPDGTVLFAGFDVAKALGYSNTRDAVNRHCKGVVKRDGVSITTNQHGATSEQEQSMSFISESDVYRLIFRSKLPEAEKFTDWVTKEILPTIRRHGAYLTPETLQKAISDPQFTIGLLTELQNERTARIELQQETAKQRQLIAEYEPKVTYYDRILSCKDAISLRTIAKDYGKTAQWLNRYLHGKGVQYMQGDIWLLYDKYASLGYTKSYTYPIPRTGKTKMHTNWTQKGRLFIYKLLKSDGILPIIEEVA